MRLALLAAFALLGCQAPKPPPLTKFGRLQPGAVVQTEHGPRRVPDKADWWAVPDSIRQYYQEMAQDHLKLLLENARLKQDLHRLRKPA